jgi:hypothetical protein
MTRPRLAGFILLLLAAGCSGGGLDAVAKKPAAPALLYGARTKPVPPEVAERLAGVRRQAAAERGLAFKSEPSAVYMDEKSFDAFLDELVRREVKPAEVARSEAIIKAFGFAGPDFDLIAETKKILHAEAAGFYHPKTRRLVMIEREGGILGRMGAGLDAPGRALMEDVLLIHEHTHALQDQHFDLEKLKARNPDFSDGGLALDALIEGDATNIMLEHALGLEIHRVPLMGAALALTLSNPDQALEMGGIGPDADAMRAAPRVLREGLLFSYLRGLTFCLHLRGHGGSALVDRAFAAPPVSSSQILHPKKYLDPGDAPREIALSPPAEVQWHRAAEGALGEFYISVLFRTFDIEGATAAAAGWDGDRFIVFDVPGSEGKAGGCAIVWASEWDTDEDAGEFAAALIAAHVKRFPEDAESGDTAGRFASNDEIIIRGTRVAYAQGAGAASAGLIEAALQAESRKMTAPRPSLEGIQKPAKYSAEEFKAIEGTLKERMGIMSRIQESMQERPPAQVKPAPPRGP